MTSPSLPGGTWSFGDLEVTRFGYGAMQLAGPWVFGPPADHDGAIAVLRAAVELGITHIDTSAAYGPRVTNELIREALHPYPESLHVVTKVGAFRDEQGGWPTARDRASIERQVHENLETLGLDTLDVVNLRMGDAEGTRPESVAEPFETLLDPQQQGLIRHLGVSNVTAEQIAEARSLGPIVGVQNMYNLAVRHDDELIDELAADGIAYVPFFPLGGFSPLQSDVLSSVAERLGATPLGRAELAAAAVAEHPADRRDVVGRAPARERQGRGAAPPAGRRRGTGPDRPVNDERGVVATDRRQRRWHELHDRLYDAACELFLANGYRATSVDDIAERADVARKTAFNHYPRKRDFIGEWGSRRRESVLAALAAQPPAAPDIDSLLRRYFAELAAINRAQRALTICMFEGWRDSGGPFDAEPHDLQDVLRGFLADAIARGEIPASVDPARLGTVLYSSYFGLLHDWCRGPVRRAPFDLAKAFDQLLDIVLRGVRGG